MADTCRWCGSKRVFTTGFGRDWFGCGSWDQDGGESWQSKDCRIAELERTVERMHEQIDWLWSHTVLTVPQMDYAAERGWPTLREDAK